MKVESQQAASPDDASATIILAVPDYGVDRNISISRHDLKRPTTTGKPDHI